MIALDTNILVYADDVSDKHGRHSRALELIVALSDGATILPLQVVGEYLNVCWKKRVLALDQATNHAALYLETFVVTLTEANDLITAAQLANRHKLQFFDALIIAVARRAGATILLSEDMADGLVVEGLTVVNPFNPANQAVLQPWFG